MLSCDRFAEPAMNVFVWCVTEACSAGVQSASVTLLVTLLNTEELRSTRYERIWKEQKMVHICKGLLLRFPCWSQMAKVFSRPFCTVCERHFRTPRKFVEHMKSLEHKQKVEEVCTQKFWGKKETFYMVIKRFFNKLKCGYILQQDKTPNHEVKLTAK